MERQNNTLRQSKPFSFKISRKKVSTKVLNKIIAVLFFAFLINLSLKSQQLFLEEILITTGIIGMLLFLKRGHK